MIVFKEGVDTMKKRFGIGILFLMVAIWVLPVSVKAAAEEKSVQTVTVYDGDESDLFYEVESRMKNAMLAGESQISLSDLRIPVGKERYNPGHVIDLSPYLGQLKEVNPRYIVGQDYFFEMVFENPMNEEQTKAYFNLVDAKLEELYDVVNAG